MRISIAPQPKLPRLFLPIFAAGSDSKKLDERVGGFLRFFLQDPMTCILRTTTVTSFATSFACSPSCLPNDLSPPTDNTGMDSFVCESCAKSFASCGQEAK